MATHFAPLVVFPVAVGISLEAGLALTLRLLNTAHQASLLGGTIIAGMVLVVGQHFGSYLARRHRLGRLGPTAALLRYPRMLVSGVTQRSRRFCEKRGATPGGRLAGKAPRGCFVSPLELPQRLRANRL
ncbi:MAG TPA: hypothetical protein VGG64_16725 [Pirellulales bacterium]